LLLIDRHHGRITPQPLELVELAERGVKYVNHHVHIIEKDPASLLNSLDVMSARTFLA
jgi:hypothetical protein